MLDTRARTTRTALGGLTLGLAIVLAACGADESTSDPGAQVSTTEHNNADVTFASNMIQHHAQALTMVDLTAGRPLDTEVQQLAEDIRAAQTPEIEEMTDWLHQLGRGDPRDHARPHQRPRRRGEHGRRRPGPRHARHGQPGRLEELQDASDGEFQDMWLAMMVDHHRGAVEMATTEQEEGQYAPAADLAGRIIDSQTKEIETMNGLLS